jgi:hypothetical protein
MSGSSSTMKRAARSSVGEVGEGHENGQGAQLEHVPEYRTLERTGLLAWRLEPLFLRPKEPGAAGLSPVVSAASTSPRKKINDHCRNRLGRSVFS